ncbi:MAG: CPBP family intramembrane glutamic endopeptidase [Halobacteriota archaeon]
MQSIRSRVWNEHEHRFRMPVRLLLGVLIVLVCSTVPVALLAMTGRIGVVEPAGALPSLTAGAVVSGLGSLVGITVAGHWLDRRRLGDFGLRVDRRWLIDLTAGAVLGIGLVVAIVLLQLPIGWIDRVSIGSDVRTQIEAILALLVLFCVVGVYEEVLFRGYVLTNLAEGLRGVDALDERGAVAVATVLTAVVFALLHLLNPGASLASAIGIAIAGVTLGAGYAFTGELGVPIGLHITWNATLGVGFGVPVSGLVFPVSLLDVASTAPTIWSGGAFGPEAGLFGVAAMLVGFAAIAGYVSATRDAVEIHESIAIPDLRTR